MRSVHVLALVAGLAVSVAACGGSSVAAPSSPAAASALPDPTAVPNPGAGDASSPAAGTVEPPGDVPGAGQPGAGAGTGTGGGGDLGVGLPAGDLAIQEPVPGARNPHDVQVDGLQARERDGALVAVVTWWSGPAPCTVLAGVVVAQPAPDAWLLTVREGSGRDDVVCTGQAVHKAAVVELGPWPEAPVTVQATGVAAPVTVTP